MPNRVEINVDSLQGTQQFAGLEPSSAPNCENLFDERHYGNKGKTANVVISDTEMKDVGYHKFPTSFQYVYFHDW